MRARTRNLRGVDAQAASRFVELHRRPARWRRPTLGEFVERLESQLGPATDLSHVLLAGFGRSERLEPADVRLLCGQLGVPPEDFDLDP